MVLLTGAALRAGEQQEGGAVVGSQPGDVLEQCHRRPRLADAEQDLRGEHRRGDVALVMAERLQAGGMRRLPRPGLPVLERAREGGVGG